MYGEKRVVIFAVITTLIAFFLVYFLYFNQNSSQKIFESIRFGSKDASVSDIEIPPDLTGDLQVSSDNRYTTSGENLLDLDNVDWTGDVSTGKNSSDKIKMFISSMSGLKMFSGNFRQIVDLNISSNFILNTDTDIYFANISGSVENIMSDIQKKGGKTVEIEDKKIIINNYLTGDKVIYLNIPQYQNQKVLILIYFENHKDYWLVHVPYDIYYKSKSVITNFFRKYEM